MADFYCWADVAGEEEPAPAAAGAAMMALVVRNELPPFALGPWYDALKAAGAGQAPPARLCWAAEDAILLAPYRVDAGHWGGYLIAMEESAGELREFWSPEGEVVRMIVPEEVGSEEPVEAHPRAVLEIDGAPALDMPS